jgi:PAS domain-containing protein
MRMMKMKNKDILREVFDAIPSAVFVVDQDVRIQEYNAAAADLLAADKKTILKNRAGDILHCIHSNDVPEGCGRSRFCKDCIVRNSVAEAFQGKRVVRRRARMEIFRDEKKIEIYALITVSPFVLEEKLLSLLVVEDISEIAELYRMIPICSICGKVRDDKASWMRVESYFKDNWDLDFSHGLCPDCYKIEMDKLKILLGRD